MTRKDYQLIANALLRAGDALKDIEEAKGWHKAVDFISEALEADNPKFNAQKFYEATHWHSDNQY